MGQILHQDQTPIASVHAMPEKIPRLCQLVLRRRPLMKHRPRDQARVLRTHSKSARLAQ